MFQLISMIKQTNITYLILKFLLFCFKNWYALAKTLAEDAAWRFAEEKGISLVTLNPGLVIGPLLQPNINFSVEIILNIVKGNLT